MASRRIHLKTRLADAIENDGAHLNAFEHHVDEKRDEATQQNRVDDEEGQIADCVASNLLVVEKRRDAAVVAGGGVCRDDGERLFVVFDSIGVVGELVGERAAQINLRLGVFGRLLARLDRRHAIERRRRRGDRQRQRGGRLVTSNGARGCRRLQNIHCATWPTKKTKMTA